MKCGQSLTTRIDSEGKPRLSCSDEKCGFVFYNNPVPVVGAVVEYCGTDPKSPLDAKSSVGEVILVQNIGWPKELFGIVTGFLGM